VCCFTESWDCPAGTKRAGRAQDAGLEVGSRVCSQVFEAPLLLSNSPCAPTTLILFLCDCLYTTTRPASPVTSRRGCLASNKADLEISDQWTPSSVLIRECKGGKLYACASVRID